MNKYEFTGETKDRFGTTLHRIRRLSDGEIGGWIESKENLSHDGDAWVYGDAQVYGDARVYGAARVSGGALVSGGARVYGDARVSGDAWVSGDARVYGAAQVYGDAHERSPLYIQGTRHALTVCAPGRIMIGCEDHTFEEWTERYREIGKANGYSEDEAEEYRSHIAHMIRVSKELAS